MGREGGIGPFSSFHLSLYRPTEFTGGGTASGKKKPRERRGEGETCGMRVQKTLLFLLLPCAQPKKADGGREKKTPSKPPRGRRRRTGGPLCVSACTVVVVAS